MNHTELESSLWDFFNQEMPDKWEVISFDWKFSVSGCDKILFPYRNGAFIVRYCFEFDELFDDVGSIEANVLSIRSMQQVRRTKEKPKTRDDLCSEYISWRNAHHYGKYKSSIHSLYEKLVDSFYCDDRKNPFDRRRKIKLSHIEYLDNLRTCLADTYKKY